MSENEARSIVTVESSVIGTHQAAGEKLGWLVVSPVFRDYGAHEQLGNQVILAVGDIGEDPVQVKETQYLRGSEPEAVSEQVTGVKNANTARLFLTTNSDWDISGWRGNGYYKRLGSYGFVDPPFANTGYRDAPIASGRWLVGKEAILPALKAEIAQQFESEDLSKRAYLTFYLRFNQLLASSYRNRRLDKASETPILPLSEILIIDEGAKEAVIEEATKAQQFIEFTQTHIAANKAQEQRISNGIPKKDIPDFVEQFTTGRDELRAQHDESYRICGTMLDSNYVPAGIRRSWPYMDLGDYEMEAQAARMGNFGMVDKQLLKEREELEYKIREVLLPRFAVVQALAGLADHTIY